MKRLRDPEANSTAVCLGTAVISKTTWRLVALLFLLYVVAYLDRINIGFAALQIQSRFHLSDASYGFAAGVFFAGYVVLQLPSNMILNRIGARRWIAALMTAWGIIAWGIISSRMIFVRGPWQLYVLRFLLGSAEAGFFPGIVLYLKGWFPTTTRARTVALFAAAGPVSAVIAGPLSATLLGLHQAGLAGWQWMFLLEGGPAVFLGIGVFFYLTDTPKEAYWLSPEERAWLLAALLQEDETPGFRNRNGIFEVFTSLHIWLADRSGEYRWYIAGPALLGAFALVSAGYSSSVTGLVGAISLVIVAEFSPMGPFWALSTTIDPNMPPRVLP
jgi:ACS family tartrate transporter-like MFS transporter